MMAALTYLFQAGLVTAILCMLARIALIGTGKPRPYDWAEDPSFHD